jgi:hypothetical protein
VQTTTGAQQYLANLKPKPMQLSPLDKPLPLSKAAEYRYHRALEIAEQPAIILQKIKDGNLQKTDLQDLKGLYPNYYNNLCQKLTNQIANAKGNEEPIPYKSKLSISLCLGQPLDSSMKPEAIVAAQPKPNQPSNQAPMQQKANKTAKIGNKTNNMYKTSSQEAESDRSNRS